jgi:hypothetical protein
MGEGAFHFLCGFNMMGMTGQDCVGKKKVWASLGENAQSLDEVRKESGE